MTFFSRKIFTFTDKSRTKKKKKLFRLRRWITFFPIFLEHPLNSTALCCTVVTFSWKNRLLFQSCYLNSDFIYGAWLQLSQFCFRNDEDWKSHAAMCKWKIGYLNSFRPRWSMTKMPKSLQIFTNFPFLWDHLIAWNWIFKNVFLLQSLTLK